ncbi:4-(cytidine 5'-diphospho)-2-C-methyl-D-erythritol kinase [Sedimentitalea todarodis]|uniref:4-diphosphocytidyl-2-C-methyl-D-erythritol kinase n=1 Tax=Sedimentitalea todarodis TaxID=1631240 RepID=A0ABU3VI07_9RHOB|nr:4-(cytidine 5'-diphospho)-2-C-methyl-D-erythritol kinase [Sedimentitalea todarodis]MDU9005808.1 4-(cytidine 5'-diphospho)-2-C-methyl-D-erythritol kinase [Sedimentitalea todarodis]
MTKAKALARAKINLTLHVTGQRQDGYHLLDSLVVFADYGDTVSVHEAEGLTLRISGPKAAGLPGGEDNLVLCAARLAGVSDALITLDKHLPAAAGIGGGSADAAATLRALCISHGAAIPTPEQILELGADVPICLAGKSLRMGGIGERIDPVPAIPPLPAILVNPGLAVHTPDVFRALTFRNGTPMPDVPAFSSVADCAKWLAQQRNDLEGPAMQLCPSIGDCLAALRDQNAVFARMSGSGATCFGLFKTPGAARAECHALRRAHPEWWVQAVILGGEAPEGQSRRDTT